MQALQVRENLIDGIFIEGLSEFEGFLNYFNKII